MKKIAAVVIAVLIPALTACGILPSQEGLVTKETGAVPVSSPNLAAHIKNGGSVAEHDGWIYYINPEKDLCRMKEDASEKTVLVGHKENTARLNYINITDDSLYYCETIITDTEYSFDAEFETIYKISLDGASKTKIFSTFDTYDKPDVEYIEGIRNMTVVDAWIYFAVQNGWGSKTNFIYKMRTDGTELTRLTDTKCDNLMIVDGWMYYVARGDGNTMVAQKEYIYKMRLDGSEVSCFNDNYDDYKEDDKTKTRDGISAFVVDADNEWIYYTTNDYTLYKIRTDFTEKSMIYKSNSFFPSAQAFNTHGDWVYVSAPEYLLTEVTNRNSGYFFRVNSSGEKQMIEGGSYIIGEWIYFNKCFDEQGERLEKDTLYRIRLDGTERELIE